MGLEAGTRTQVYPVPSLGSSGFNFSTARLPGNATAVLSVGTAPASSSTPKASPATQKVAEEEKGGSNIFIVVLVVLITVVAMQLM